MESSPIAPVTCGHESTRLVILIGLGTLTCIYLFFFNRLTLINVAGIVTWKA
jgi:hypothetical protein